MLCLSRKENETIHITTAHGEQIVVRVVSLDRGKVMLGIEADRSVIIDRSEVRLSKEADRLNGEGKRHA